jgi:hypothetical protein
MNLVRVLHVRQKLSIVASIGISVGAYLALAVLLDRLVPKSAAAFCLALVPVTALGFVVLTLQPRRSEGAYRSLLPLGGKIAAIAAVVVCVVLLKQVLGGFMTMFPLVSTIAAYEARHSLWTMSRQVPIFILEMVPMLATMWLAQNLLKVGIPLSLAIGWAAFLAVMVPVNFAQMRRQPDVSTVKVG